MITALANKMGKINLTIAIGLIGFEILLGSTSKADHKSSDPYHSDTSTVKRIELKEAKKEKKSILDQELYKYSLHPNDANEIDTIFFEYIGLNVGHGFVGFGYQDRTAVWDTINIERTYNKLLGSQALEKPLRTSDIKSTFQKSSTSF